LPSLPPSRKLAISLMIGVLVPHRGGGTPAPRLCDSRVDWGTFPDASDIPPPSDRIMVTQVLGRMTFTEKAAHSGKGVD
jgi:hypothetical protein